MSKENISNKYIIFEAQHISSLYQFITLKFTRFYDKKIIFLVNKKDFDKLNFSQNFIKFSIFDKIISFSEPFFKDNTNENDIINFYDNIFAENNISFNNTLKIVTACDVQNAFAIYCALNNQKITYMEIAPKQFEDKSRYYINSNLGCSSKWFDELSIKFGALSGDKNNMENRYMFPQSKIVFNNKDILIDFNNLFFNLDKQIKIKILKCFDLDINLGKDVKNVLLLNSIGWTFPQTKLSMPKYYLPYLSIADYYFKNNEDVYIKDHPQNNLFYFNSYVKPYSKTLDSSIPIEFLALLDNLHINRLISIDSTGGSKISPFIEKEIRLGRSYLSRGWFCNHKLYSSLMVYDFLNINYECFTFGIDLDYLNNFCKYSDIKSNNIHFSYLNTANIKPNSFNLIGYYDNNHYSQLEQFLIDLDNNSVVVFFNFDSNKIISYKNTYLLNYFLPFTFHLEKTRNTSLCEPTINKLFVFCKNEQTRKNLLNFEFNRNLNNLGAKIFVNANDEHKNYNNEILNLKFDILVNQIQNQQNEIEKLKNIILNDKD